MSRTCIFVYACRDFIIWLATAVCLCCFGLFWFHMVAKAAQDWCQKRQRMSVHLLCVIILTEVAGVGSNYSAACMTCLFVSALFHTFRTDGPPRMFPPPLPTQHAAPNPVVKLSLLYLRDSRTPSASCHAESGPSHAAEIRRLLSQMSPRVFHRSFVVFFFLILLWFRLSCRTLRRVQALKCD